MKRRRGWALLGLGALSLAGGVGLGMRPVSSGAWGWRGVTGLGLAILGLTFVVIAIRSLTAGFRPVVAGVATVGLILLTATAAWLLAPAVLATAVPSTPRGDISPTEFGLEAETVTYPSNGAELAAWYVPPLNGAVVIVRHGSGSNATSVLRHAEVLARHGYGLLLTDARGHGDSTGPAMDFGWFGEADITGSVNFLSSRPEVDPGRIAVLGLSMGGEEAIGAIGSDSRVAAVVAEGATARTDGDKAWLAEEFGWRGRLQMSLEWLQYSVADILSPASRPPTLASSARAAAPRPILLIAAGDLVDEQRAAEFIAGDSGNVEIWVAEGAGHMGALGQDPGLWEDTVVGFLERALAG